MKYHFGLTISILFLIACTEEKPVKIKEPSLEEIAAKKKANEEAQNKQEQAAVIATYRATNPLENEDLWHNDEIKSAVRMKSASLSDYQRFWADSLKDEKQILKFNAKMAIIRDYNYDDHNYYPHKGAFFVKKLTGQKISLPNIHLDTLDSKLGTKNLVKNLKNDWFDKIDLFVSDDDFKRNLITKDLLKRFKLFYSLWVQENPYHYWENSKFPLVYRDDRTVTYLWTQIKPILFKEITKQQFDKLSGSFYVNTLLRTYNLAELHKKCQDVIASKQQLSSVRFNLETTHCENNDIDYSSLMTKEYREQFKSQGENQEKELGGYLCCFRTWFLSFWFRRHIEGTDKITHQILVEIKDHYK